MVYVVQVWGTIHAIVDFATGTNKLVYLCSDCLTKVNEWKAISLYPKTHVCLPIPSLTKMEVNAGKLFAFCHLKALAKDTVSN